MSAHGVPRAAVGHMPFAGHRNQGTVRKVQEAARKRAYGQAIKMAFGFDPESLVKSKEADAA